MQIQSKSKKDDSLLLILAFSVMLLSHMWDFPSKIWIVIELFVGFCLFLRHVLINKLCITTNDLYIPVFSTLFFALSYIIVGNDRLEEHIISMVFYYSIALTMKRCCYDNKKMYKFAAFVNIFLIIYIIIVGFDNVFYDVSHNITSVFLLVIDAPVFINADTIEQETKGKQLVLSILGFIAAVLSVGRGGILCMGLLMMFTICNMIFSRSSKMTFLKFMTIVGVLATVIYVVINPEILQVVLARFIDRKDIAATDEPRYIMNMEYLNQLNGAKEWLFGVNLENCNMINMYGKNPHNSLIGIHSNYGLIWLIMCAYGVYKAIKFSLREKRWQYFCFVVIIVIRSFLDLAAGIGPFDIILFTWMMANYRKVEIIP